MRRCVILVSPVLLGIAMLTAAATYALQVREYKSGIIWPEPPVVTPGPTNADPPSDAIVLFNGKDLSQWIGGEDWEIRDGYAIARKRGITTK
ncbi:MAG: DUF1080 domain-containing protein [Gemmataceae bacterium]|nr:DUF1080 domain-containing protein [Gemmataceae bacterium]